MVEKSAHTFWKGEVFDCVFKLKTIHLILEVFRHISCTVIQKDTLVNVEETK